MGRVLLFVLLTLGLLVVVAGSALAVPDQNALTGTFPVKVVATTTSTGWDYVVTVDPDHAYPGWGIKGFGVYAGNVTHQESNSWKGFDGGGPANWKNDGNWHGSGTTARFGWDVGNPALMSGSTGTFHAVSLPVGFANWSQIFGVHVVPANGNTYWSQAKYDNGGGGPPQETPEPTSLMLLTLGGGAIFGAIKRRKSS